MQILWVFTAEGEGAGQVWSLTRQSIPYVNFNNNAARTMLQVTIILYYTFSFFDRWQIPGVYREFAKYGEWGKFAASVGHPKAKRFSASAGGFAPPRPPTFWPGALPWVHPTFFDLATPLVKIMKHLIWLRNIIYVAQILLLLFTHFHLKHFVDLIYSFFLLLYIKDSPNYFSVELGHTCNNDVVSTSSYF